MQLLRHTVLFDTDVLLDVLQRREPFYKSSAALWAAAEAGHIRGLIASHGLPMLFFMLARHAGRKAAHRALTDMLTLFDIATVGHLEIEDALKLGYLDFEDAVQMTAAMHAQADFLATRCTRNYSEGTVTVLQPAALLVLLDLPHG